MPVNTPPAPASRQYVDYDEFVDFQLEKARSHIKTTEIFTTLTLVAASFVGYLLAFVVCDQWVFSGGLSAPWRTALLTIVVAVLGTLLVRRVVWPLLRRVHPLYAARVIEKSDPNLRSNLLNFVDLREADQSSAAPMVLRAMEKRAAVELSHVDVDDAIDRRPLLRTAYALLGIVVVSALYIVFSPKDPFTSVKRALLPAASIDAATETTIADVTPGDDAVPARTQLAIEADVRGSGADRVQILFTTADHKYVNQPVDMRRIDEDLPRFRGILNGENGRGILQNLSYAITAGDARTRDFHIEVIQPPSARVDEVDYSFPDYMRLTSRTDAGGAIDGWEGAQVTLRATANLPLKSARIVLTETEDPLAKGEEIGMQVTDGVNLSAQWKLAFRSDGTYARYYHIQVKTAREESDPEPTVHPLRIRPDQRPEVTLLAPTHDLVGEDARAANAVVPLVIQAVDPDFELRLLTLKVEAEGQELYSEPLFINRDLGQSFRGSHDWDLSRMGKLSPGKLVEFWIEARDNKVPVANRGATPKLKLEIRPEKSPDDVQKELARDKERQAEQIARADDAARQDAQEPATRDAADDAADEQPDQVAKDDPQPSSPPSPPPQDLAARQPQDNGDSDSGDRNEEGGNSSNPPPPGDNFEQALQKLLQRDEEQDGQPPQEESPPGDRSTDSAAQRDQEPAGKRDEPRRDSGAREGKSGKSGDDNPQKNDRPGREKRSTGSSSPKQPAVQDNERERDASSGEPPPPDERSPSDPPAADEEQESRAPQRDPESDSDASGSPDASDRDSAEGTAKKPTDAGPAKSDTPKPGQEGTTPETGTKGGSKKEQTGTTGTNENDRNRDDRAADRPSERSDSTPAQKPEKTSKEKQRSKPSKEPTESPDDKTTDKPADKGADKPSDKSPDKPTENPSENPSPSDKEADKPTKKSADDPTAGEDAGHDDSETPTRPTPKNDPSSDGRGDGADSREESDGGGKPSRPRDKSASEKPGDAEGGETDSDEGDQAAAKKSKGGADSTEREPAADDPTARKEKGTGTEKGKATGSDEEDPEAGRASDDVERDPASPPGKTQPSQNTQRKPADAEEPGDDSQQKPRPKSKRQSKSESNSTSNDDAQDVETDPQGKQRTEQPGKTDNPPSDKPNSKSTRKPEQRPSNPPDAGNQPSQGEGRKKRQESQQPDTGEQGRSSASDEGESGGNQEGAGDKGDQPGDSEQAAGKTGKPGDKKGKGSTTSPAKQTESSESAPKDESCPPSGGQDGSKGQGGSGKKGEGSGESSSGESDSGDSPSGNQPGSKPGTSSSSAGKSSAKPGAPGSNPSSSPEGGGMSEAPEGGAGPTGEGTGNADGSEPDAVRRDRDFDSAPSPEEEQANLEYARKASNLLLKRLKQQLERGEVDEELLEQMGWKDMEDVARFTQFLEQQLSQQGDDNSPEALARKLQFEEMLKSLRLKSETQRRRGGANPERRVVPASSRNQSVPAEYREQWEAYTKSLEKKVPEGTRSGKSSKKPAKPAAPRQPKP